MRAGVLCLYNDDVRTQRSDLSIQVLIQRKTIPVSKKKTNMKRQFTTFSKKESKPSTLKSISLQKTLKLSSFMALTQSALDSVLTIIIRIDLFTVAISHISLRNRNRNRGIFSQEMHLKSTFTVKALKNILWAKNVIIWVALQSNLLLLTDQNFLYNRKEHQGKFYCWWFAKKIR